jgi:hypothetical protein
LICGFHSFFLKPLSVTLPYAARFTWAEWLAELTLKLFRRASAMTARAWALPDIATIYPVPRHWAASCVQTPVSANPHALAVWIITMV